MPRARNRKKPLPIEDEPVMLANPKEEEEAKLDDEIKPVEAGKAKKKAAEGKAALSSSLGKGKFFK